MTDSLRRAGYSSRVPKELQGAGAAPGAGTPVPRLGLWRRPVDEPLLTEQSLRARVLVVCAGKPVRTHPADRARDASTSRAMDDKHAFVARYASPSTSGWQACDASWKAREFVNLLGPARAGATPRVLEADCRAVLLAAPRVLRIADLPHVTEALVRKVAAHAGGFELQEVLAGALVDAFSEGRGTFEQNAGLLAGVLRGLGSELLAGSLLENLAKRVIHRHVAQDGKACGGSRFTDVEGLFNGMSAVARGAGGAATSVGRLDRLLAGLTEVVDDGRSVAPDDLATALALICDAMGGDGMPAPLRRVLVAFVCDPARRFSPAARGVMAYELGVSLALWKAPPDLPMELLAAAGGTPGLSCVEVAFLAWGVGLHLLGEDPEEAEWHDTHADLVTESTAPPDKLVAAVAALAERLPASCRQRISDGLAFAQAVRERAHGRSPDPPDDSALPGESPEHDAR